MHYLKADCNEWAHFLMQYLRFHESSLGGFLEGKKLYLLISRVKIS